MADSSKDVLKNQAAILANQKKILANQALIEKNQTKLEKVIANQRTINNKRTSSGECPAFAA